MNLALRKPLSLTDFLDWEDRQELRYEFDGVQTVAMTGGTRAHSTIQGNVALAIASRLRGKPCRFHGSHLKIEVAGSIRYPDGFVACTPGDPKDKVVRDPVVIFEVMSESTWRTDLVTKNKEYAATPSVRRYVILAQDTIGGTVFERVGDDWVGHLLTADSILRMPEIEVEVPLAEFYEGVDLTEAARAAES